MLLTLIDVLAQDQAWTPSAVRISDGSGALHWACVHGEMEVALRLIRSGADVNTSSSDDASSPLWHACAQGYADVAMAILSSEAVDPTAMDVAEIRSETNALFWAVRWSWMEPRMNDVVERLLAIESRVDVVHADTQGTDDADSAMASEYDNAPPDGDGDPSGFNPAGTSTLWWAAHTAEEGDDRLAVALLRAMAENGEAYESLSAVAAVATTSVLIEACFNECSQLALSLIEADADVGVVCEEDGTDALFWACTNAMVDVALALARSGGVDATLCESETETTALYLATLDPAMRDVAFALIELGADCACTSASHSHSTALYHAAKNGDAELCSALLQGGALIDRAVDEPTSPMNNYTPLMRACSNNCVEVVTLLLAAGAETESVDANGQAAADILWNAHGVDIRQLYPAGSEPPQADAEDDFDGLL